jgi:hypothetical protein
MPKKSAPKGGAKRRGSGPTLIQRSRQVPDEQKALYHQVLGTGRSRITRKFLGLTEGEEDQIREKIKAMIRNGLRRSS